MYLKSQYHTIKNMAISVEGTRMLEQLGIHGYSICFAFSESIELIIPITLN